MTDKYMIKTVKTKNAETDTVIFGTGKQALVIIPGISAKPITDSAGVLSFAYKDFSFDYTVYVIDRKKDIRSPYSIEQMGEDTFDVMTSLGIENVCVFGASQGGMIAMYLAAYHPQTVKKAVLGSTAAKLSSDSVSLMEKWSRLGSNGKVSALFSDMITNIYSEEYIERYKAFLSAFASSGTAEECYKVAVLSKACMEFDFSEKLDMIKCPLLVIGSRKDKVLGSESSLLISELTGCELYMYEGYSHAVYDEADDYKKILISFFSNDP